MPRPSRHIGKLEPGYRADLVEWSGEAGIVYTKDLKDNSGRAFSTTPGHFEDFICTSD